MSGYLPLLIAACLLAVLAAGAATALPAEETSIEGDAETNESDAGFCLVGAESPCNGDAVDDSPANGSGEEGEMGVCVVGAGGPCNGEDTAPGDSTEESTDGVYIGDENESAGGTDAGICVVGAGGPCNDAAGDESERIGAGPADGPRGIPIGPVGTHQQSQNPVAGLVSLLWSLLHSV